MDDYILLAHGNGGKFTSRLIQSCFLPYLKDPVLHQLNDQAIVDMEGCRIAFTTDSFVVHPLVFPGGPVAPLLETGLVVRSVASLFVVSLIAGYVPSWLTTREEILSAIRG